MGHPVEKALGILNNDEVKTEDNDKDNENDWSKAGAKAKEKARDKAKMSISNILTEAKEKQAENGLQSRSSENSKIAVWHYGFKLQ